MIIVPMIRGNNTDTLEVHKWRSYFVFFPHDFREVKYRLALRHNEELDEETKKLMSYVLYALYENGLLLQAHFPLRITTRPTPIGVRKPFSPPQTSLLRQWA